MKQSKLYKSKLDKEEQKKKETEKAVDYIKSIENAPNAEAERKFVVDELKSEEKKEQDIKDTVASLLESDPKIAYHTRLAEYGQTGLLKLDWPVGWEGYCIPTYGKDIRIYGKWFNTKVGIQVVVKDSSGSIYCRGVLTTMDPLVDMSNVDTLVVQAENTIDSAKGILLSDKKADNTSLKKTNSGIVLPN